MENFLSTVVFILPGFLLYFWIQSFGINPVVKHSTIELTAISALLWLPVSVSTLAVYNGLLYFSRIMEFPVWSIEELQNVSGNLLFLTSFLILSVFVSFAFGVLWSMFLYPIHLKIINCVRKLRGVAEFSKTPSVWDEVFLKNEPQVVEYGKIGEEEKSIKGEIEKVSRPFEPDRNIFLRDIDFYTNLIHKHKIPVSRTFIDTRTGTYVKIYDSKKIKEAICSEESTSSPIE